jgi:aspartate/methionine/tyrosine aminotransferase
MDSKTLADGLLTKAGVAALSGTSFGTYGEGYLRLSFANSQENLRTALQRMSEYLKEVRTSPLSAPQT